MTERPPFCAYLTASGHGEIWDHTDAKKFSQFGWRCTTNETNYSNKTLVGNWREESFDSKRLANSQPVLSQYGHYFGTTHGSSYRPTTTRDELLTSLRQAGGISKEPKIFPGHQPELDNPKAKAKYNSFETASMAAYKHPQSMK